MLLERVRSRIKVSANLKNEKTAIHFAKAFLKVRFSAQSFTYHAIFKGKGNWQYVLSPLHMLEPL